MKCLNCGCESENFLCKDCTTENILDTIFHNLEFFNPDTCGRYLKEYVESCESPYKAWNCLPDILCLFNASVSNYYYCRYYKHIKDEKFEETAVKYLDEHKTPDLKWQTVLRDILDYYSRNDFIKPQKWCRYIRDTDGLYCELYYSAADFFAMVGDYDVSEEIIQKALTYCNNNTYNSFLCHTREAEIESLNKLSETVSKYRKKPYWPQKEDRRRALAVIYDEKGITHRRIGKKPVKVKESDFIPVSESSDKPGAVYCAFWCAGVFSYSAAKDIYQIAAIRVRDGAVLAEFQNYIRPEKATVSAKNSIAKEAGIDVEILNSAEDVDQVMEKFFAFVGNDILVSTGALGNQEDLITRAARYTGMKNISNQFFDLLDYAAAVSQEFDMQNNTREYLLDHFKIKEGSDALGKARANIEIYNYLKELDKE